MVQKKCPYCGSERFQRGEDGYGQCYALNCGLRSADQKVWSIAATVWESIYRDCHQALLSAHSDLTPVMAHSLIGELPVDADFSARVVPHIEDARKKLEALEAAKPQGRPSIGRQLLIAEARQLYESLKQLADDLGVVRDHAARRCYFWTAANHAIVSMTTETSDRTTVRIGQGGVFNHGLPTGEVRSEGTRDLRGRLLMVESPSDVFAVQSLGATVAAEESLPPESGYIWCAAVGDVPDAATVRALTRMPLLLMPLGPTRQAALQGIRQRANFHMFAPPLDWSVTKWLGQMTDVMKGWKYLVECSRQAALVTRPFDAVRKELDGIRRVENRQLKKFEVDRWVTDEIVRDLQERGRLYFDGQMPYVYLHDTHEVWAIDVENDDWNALAREYGIAVTDTIARPLVSEAYLSARADGVQAKVHPYAHYDRNRNVVYLFDLDKGLYRITPHDVKEVPNGTDGKLFVRNRKWTPFKLLDVTVKREWPNVAEELLRGLQLEERHLTRADYVFLLQVWLLAFFFPERFPTRPILTMVGPMGSGKTSLLERWGKLLFGPAFKVASLTDDLRDFDAALTNEYYVVADNADQERNGLPNKLAVVATGATLKRRVLFTTNRLIEFPLTAWLGITCRTPHFRREDVANRLLPIQVTTLQSAFIPYGQMQGAVQERRNLLLTALVVQVQAILAEIEAEQS